MRRWILFAIALTLFSFLPNQGTDIGNLRPVGLLYVYWENGAVTAAADTGDLGRGKTIREALEDMKATSQGEIFLETTEKVLITESVLGELDTLAAILRPGTELCLGQMGLNPEEAYEYLHTRETGAALYSWKKNQKLPKLDYREGRYHLA